MDVTVALRGRWKHYATVLMKIAVISTVWFPLSHTDVIVTRWVEPYHTDAENGWVKPKSTIAAIFIEQTPENDIGHRFCQDNGIPIFDSIAGALTMGTGTLAVDAVLLIAEHGNYPLNEFRQRLYPRKQMFDAIVGVFRESGRSVPVFNDKHFSWDFGHSCEMLAVAGEMGFPLYGGSSLTHCPVEPGPAVGENENIREALAVFHGDPDHYGFHTMEFVQSQIERRSGGETGICAVRSFEGQAVRDAVDSGDIPRDLLIRAMEHHGYTRVEQTLRFILERTENLLAHQLEHADGLRVTHIALPKFVSEWIVAVRTADGMVRSSRVRSGDGGRDFFSNFAYLNARVESFIQTGKEPTPVLRTHLVTGALQAALQALRQDGRWMETPYLSVAY